VDLLLQLRHFVVLAEELSFGRAARRIGMAQPPLSQGIRRLETHLGTELVDRSRRQIALTTAGSALLVEARSLLATVDQLPARLAPERPGDRRLLLGVPQTCTAQELTAVARELEHVRPVVLDPDERTDALDDGEVDVALVQATADTAPADSFDHELGFVGTSAPLHPVDISRPVLVSREEDRAIGPLTPLDQLRRRGLAPHLIETAQDPLAAAIEARLERAYWLTTADHAHRFDLPWHPVVGRPVLQRYQLRWHSPDDEAHLGTDLRRALRSEWPARGELPLERRAQDWGLYPR
jgi:DNA-binding transcriptional LysR family regulator